MKCLFLFIFIILFGCGSNKQIKNETLKFRIVDEIVRDGSCITIELINETAENYYLLIDTTSFHNKFAPFNASKFLLLGFIGIEDDLHNAVEMEYEDYECANDSTDKSYNYRIKVNNILKINSNQKVYFKVPFRLKTEINDYCWYAYKKEKFVAKKKYSCFFASIKPDDYLKQRLTKEMRDSLNVMGYKLYERSIYSDKVPLFLNSNE